jgi:hypothetical protein
MGIMDSEPLADFPGLVKFSRDRLDVDEAAARAAAEEYRETWTTVWMLGTDNARIVDIDGHPVGGGSLRVVAEHQARHDPGRVLREVAARRALLDAYDASVRSVGPGLSRNYLRLVAWQATAWNDHPDYLAEWVP